MITDFYKQPFILSENIETKDGGVVKKTKTKIKDFVGILDNNTTGIEFESLRKKYSFSHILFCGELDIITGQIVTFDSIDYNVVSAINPLYRNNHMQILLEVIK